MVAIVGAWCGFDALIVTDEERLEQFVDDVTGEIDEASIVRALAWTDASSEAVEVTARGNMRVYDDQAQLETDARRNLRSFIGDNLRTLQQSIVVDGEVATVSLRLFTSRGVVDVEFRLRRHDEHWRINRVVVR